jgi:hypothetical protein
MSDLDYIRVYMFGNMLPEVGHNEIPSLEERDKEARCNHSPSPLPAGRQAYPLPEESGRGFFMKGENTFQS